MYEQLKAPNLSIIGSEGLCLVYVREVFGIPAKYPTAIAGWDNAQYQEGGTPPTNVAVPIWFKYSGPDGHVAVWSNGVIHSTSARGMQEFDSIQALINWMDEGFEYLGWSQDLNGVRVVEPASSAEEFYTVVKGDTLSGIADKYGITLKQVESLNPQISNPNVITVGEKVRIK